MRTVDMYIRKYDWSVRFFFDTNKDDIEDVYKYLLDNDYPITAIDKIRDEDIISGPNTGLTMSHDRRSVVLVSHTSSMTEFFNTLIHELRHLVDFISLRYDLGFTGETTAYLSGEIAACLYPYVVDYICC